VSVEILNMLATRHVEGQMIEAWRVAVVASLHVILLGLEERHRKEVPSWPEDKPSGGSCSLGPGRPFVSEPREQLVIECC
jgi:hypothetical protein